MKEPYRTRAYELFAHLLDEHDITLLDSQLKEVEGICISNATNEQLEAELQARKPLRKAIEKACEEADVDTHHFRNPNGRTVEIEPTAPTAKVAHDTCKFWAHEIVKHLPEDNTQVAVWQRVVKDGQLQGWVGFMYSKNGEDD